MKKVFLLISLIGIMMVSCNEQFDIPEFIEPTYNGTPANVSIYDIQQLHKLSGVVDSINDDLVFDCIVVGNDKSGNIFKKIYVQDETGGFVAMMLFPFHPDNTELGKRFNLRRVGSWEDLKMLALSRLVLDNFEHFKAFWVMLTVPIAQLALSFGADDLDGTVGEEKIIHAAGAKSSAGITRAELERIISETGYVPTLRDSFYKKN